MSVRAPRLRLTPGEEVLLVLRTHPKVLVPQVFALIVLIAAAVAARMLIPADMGEGWVLKAALIASVCLTLYYCVLPLLRWQTTTYTLTNKQIVTSRGLLYRKSHSTQLNRVSDIQTEQGILDRIFSCGTLIIENSASGTSGFNPSATSRVILEDVPHALDVEHQIKGLLHQQAS